MNNENLVNFPKGKSGNPAGKKKGTKNFKTIYKKYLSLVMNPDDSGFDIPFVDKDKKLTLQEMIVLRHIKKMIGKADARDIGMVTDRLDGLLKQQVEHSGSIKQMTEIEEKELKDELLKALLEDKGIRNDLQ